MDIQALSKTSPEEVLLPILVQLVVILLAARLCAIVCRRLGQPSVVGEILAGLLLGPSVLGHLPFIHDLFHPAIAGVAPELSEQVFHWIFAMLSQLGLIFLLFLVGLECDFSHLRGQVRSALSISIVGVALPFALGVSLAWLLLAEPSLGTHPSATGPTPTLGFVLFLGTALSITALPVLGRILLELDLLRTRAGALAISGAAVDDAMGWILLASVAAVVRSQFQLSHMLLMAGETILFALLMLFIVRPIVRRALRGWAAKDMQATFLAIVLCAAFLCSAITNLIGIFAIFGAFFLGAILSGQSELREAVAGKMRDFITAFFLPIFFTYTGLRTNVGSLDSLALWLLCGVVIAAATIGKVAGCSLAAWANGFSPRESACVGVLMNTRGLMELIVVNVGYDLRVIPPSVYCMLVLMALVTTLMTTPLLLLLSRGTPIEEHLRRTSWLRGVSRENCPAV